MTPIAPLIEAFLDETLARQRGVSRHTRDSYALASRTLRVTGAFLRLSSRYSRKALMRPASSCSSVSADGETFSLFAANMKSN